MSELSTTSLVQLRPIDVEDAPAITRLLEGDTELALQTAVIPIPYTIECAHQFLASADPLNIFAITAEGELVGMIGLEAQRARMRAANQGRNTPDLEAARPLPRPYCACSSKVAHDPVEIGYWIGRKHWGRGYATSAINLLVETARRRAFSRITATVFPANPASMRVLEKNGFIKAGKVRKDLPQRGGLRTLMHFERGL